MDQAVQLDFLPVPLLVRRNNRARRIGLRVDLKEGVPVLVLPKRVALHVGLAFVESKAAWLKARLAAMPVRVPFEAGAVVPLAGMPHVLTRALTKTRKIQVLDGMIYVPGTDEQFGPNVARWLRSHARDTLTETVQPLAARLGRTAGRVSVRDTRSRWGSCARSGDLSFSWRLILAPPHVLEYVAAHEVAHLVKRDHSDAFWKVVGGLMPRYREAQNWLLREGAGLHRYG